MGRPVVIRDDRDPRLDDFRDLARVDRRPDRPDGRGLVIAEGIPVVRRLLASPYPVRAVLGVARRLDALAADLAEIESPVYAASAEVMAGVVGFHLNRGVLASADRVPGWAVEDVLESAERIAILEGINDHENLGSMFRNAAAFGVRAVLLGPGCADPLYRRAVRVSMGHVLEVPFVDLARSASTARPGPHSDVNRPERGVADWPGALAAVRSAGFTMLALTPRPGSLALAELDPARHRRTAVLVGAEGGGLTEQALAAADLRVAIPMSTGVDSINVATAAAIAFAHLAPFPLD